MPHGDEAIQALRAALSVSPDNLPLRLHLIRSLAGYGRFEEAERECRDALSRAPGNAEIKLELAAQFAQQGKNSQALVIVEDLVKGADPPAKAFVLYARLLLRADDVRNAVAQYKNALEIDPAAADAELGERLGVRPPGDEPLAFEDEVVEGRVRATRDESGGSNTEIEKPKVNFHDVGGMEALKEEISLKIIYPLQHADLYKAYGKSIGGGILMYGPPGCGKTHLARATAGEIKANFLSIGISDVLDMWIGQSERNLHELFQQARTNKPCVLFFDEVDALGGRRADMHSGHSRHIINQFLAEMDGIERSNDGLLILAATNAPWHVDPAFRRPGRFDRVLFVPPPDQPARREILQIHLKGKPIDNIDFDQLAAKTDSFSGADLKAVVDQAIESKLREAMKAGGLKPLSTKDLLAAAKSLKPTTREWFSTARNYALYSNQGGVYDDVLKYLKM
jgi:ATP-dependent 26S proteasome regulatory subunit